jgi:penicillin-binding protein 1A
MPISYAGGAFPKNDNRRYDLARTVFSGVQSSVNAIAVHTLDKIGFEYAFEFGKEKFGLSTLTEEYILPSGTVLSDKGYAPLALGALTFGATVRDMSAAYATFMNNGIYREARTYTKYMTARAIWCWIIPRLPARSSVKRL